jgi:energy-coupling factor transport system permease protein
MSRSEGRGRLLRSSDYACQFLVHDSAVHRMGAAWKIAIGTLLSACAVGARTPVELLLLVLVTLGYYFAARLTLYDLWRDTRFLVLQGVLVIGAYCLKHGVEDGLWSGVRTSLQVIIFYLPGAVFLRTTRSRDVMGGLSRILPYRFSFLLFVSIRFVPFFLREMEEIAAAQRMRGARLLPREQLDPRNWPDLFNCLLVPLMVRALKTAEEVSRSAEAREFGSRRERTYLGSLAGVSLAGAEGERVALGASDPKANQEA